MELPIYQNGRFWVCCEEYGSGRLRPKTKGYAVYEDGVTCAKRVAQIGYSGTEGFNRAVAECDRRAIQVMPSH